MGDAIAHLSGTDHADFLDIDGHGVRLNPIQQRITALLFSPDGCSTAILGSALPHAARRRILPYLPILSNSSASSGIAL
jgi:hypothetical protein